MKQGMRHVIARHQSGSTMLEALIAILIFSLGILSLVGLLGASVKDTANSAYRTQASLLANEIIGQMWAGSQTATSVSDYLATFKGAGTVAWRNKVANSLPGVAEPAEGEEGGGDNLPVIDVDENNNVTVTVYWKTPGDSALHQYVIATRIIGNEAS